jgi:hypothetical protein
MHVQEVQLKPLSSIQITSEETTILKWINSAAWEAVKDPHGAVSYKAKVPEFFSGVRLYRLQAGGASAGSLSALELFIKKLGLQGVISKQELYPLSGHGAQSRYLSLKKGDLDNLRISGEEDE